MVINKKGRSKDVVLGEIWSLIGLVVFLLIFLVYLSSDKLDFSNTSILEADDDELNLINSAGQGFWDKTKSYLSNNRRAIIISGYIVVTLLVLYLALKLILLHFRKKRFAQQNAVSKQKLLKYQKEFNS